MLETVCSLLDTMVGARRNAIVLLDYFPIIIIIIILFSLALVSMHVTIIDKSRSAGGCYRTIIQKI